MKFLTIAVFVAVSGVADLHAAASPDDSDTTYQQERTALFAFLKTNGIELRSTENKSNVISHMYSVGPDHDKRFLVGLDYFPRVPTHADVLARGAIAIPFTINRHWVLWQVGGPGGNATKDYLSAWKRTLSAFETYGGVR